MPEPQEGPCQGPEVAEVTYHSGPPPAIGWWLTTYLDDAMTSSGWRWWDGKLWSWPVWENSSPDMVAYRAGVSLAQHYSESIVWSHYYPKDARVPRAPCPPDFEQVYDGVEHYPQMTNHIMRCCNCGTQHRMDYRVYEFTKEGVINHPKMQIGITATHLKG